jgi:colanic acid/amylovoran biosynthesis glycosyltransferase
LAYYVPNFVENNYDIIHCHFGPIANFGAKLKRIGVKGKLVASFHGCDANSFVIIHGKDVYRRLFQVGDLFIVNSNFTKDKIVALGCDESKIVRLPVGLHLDLFRVKRNNIRKKNSTIKILTIARCVEKKGLEYSIRAVSQLIPRFPNIQYRIIGDGPLRRHLESLVCDLSVSDNIEFLGWCDQNEVIRFYTESDVFILASVTSRDGDQEGQGLVLQEAQAMELPVISTHHNGISEGVLDGKTGFLVAERDVDALAGRLVQLIENPEIRHEMGSQGRKFVEQHFDIKKLNEKLVEIYEGLLSETNTAG